jgi:glutathione S-transferase
MSSANTSSSVVDGFQQDETTLLRPETYGIPKNSAKDEHDADLVFFNTFFCPFAQMVWIALMEKRVEEKTEFVEGLTIKGNGYEIHPRLQALGGSSVPTLYHPATKTTVTGSTPCIHFLDQYFGTRQSSLFPRNMKDKLKAENCEELLHSVFTLSFHAMLLHQDPEDQEADKEELLWAIEELLEEYKGPFFLGEQFSLADISMAPYFDHMIALEHYRNFHVPKHGSTAKWHEWRDNVLNRPSVAATRQDHERILESYKRYAKCYVRNAMYKRVFNLQC